LCLDKSANVVVVELKRTEDGGHMELQAIRYAAMVASMTLDRLISAHAKYLNDISRELATSEILEFLDSDSIEDIQLSGYVRILLISSDFSTELTTTVMWLNKQGLDITCLRFIPYKLEDQLLIDISQIIPLPETADYEVKIREQDLEVKKNKKIKTDIHLKFWTQLIERSKNQTDLLSSRTRSNDQTLNIAIGRSEFSYLLKTKKSESSVALLIKGDKSIFDLLIKDKEAIEAEVGEKLIWNYAPNKKNSLIYYEIEGGWSNPISEWPELQDKLINFLVKLNSVFIQKIQNITKSN